MERNLRKTRVGVVVSDKMDKTIVVAVKDSVQPVSYTHLDVYKRQFQYSMYARAVQTNIMRPKRGQNAADTQRMNAGGACRAPLQTGQPPAERGGRRPAQPVRQQGGFMAAIYQTGIDVSRYQGTIDWAAVSRAGKQFAVIRAVSSNNSCLLYTSKITLSK